MGRLISDQSISTKQFPLPNKLVKISEGSIWYHLRSVGKGSTPSKVMELGGVSTSGSPVEITGSGVKLEEQEVGARKGFRMHGSGMRSPQQQ